MEDIIGLSSEEPLKGLFNKGYKMIRWYVINIIWIAIMRMKGDQIEVIFNCPAYKDDLKYKTGDTSITKEK